ncbi:MAG: hypothetical protein Q7U66_10710 [Methylobacter sp.]|nr:hypothetical protein [Methylobacter sp.]
MTNVKEKRNVPILRTLLMEDSKELILFHTPLPEFTVRYKLEPADIGCYIGPVVKLSLIYIPISGIDSNNKFIAITDAGPMRSIYTLPLENLFSETTVIVTRLEDGQITENAYIVGDDKSTLNNAFIENDIEYVKAPKGETCFGTSNPNFIMTGFELAQYQALARAMPLVSESLCSKLGKFEAALPSGAGGRVFNIRKSQNRELLMIIGKHLPESPTEATCGEALIQTGRSTHDIHITLDVDMVNTATDIGIAVVMIHEIAHQFGVCHDGWMNTADFEGALWASHNVDSVTRTDIADYIAKANVEVGSCR